MYVPRPGNGMGLNTLDDCFPIAGFHIVVDYCDNEGRSAPPDTFPPRSGVEFPPAVLQTFQHLFHGD